MILDSSVLVAIMLNEPERDAFAARINAAQSVGVGAPTLVETGIVLSRRTGVDASQALPAFLADVGAAVIDFGPLHWRTALAAWWRFGKGRHKAALNFGDCLAYATAAVAREPLLAKGQDFAHTDITLA